MASRLPNVAQPPREAIDAQFGVAALAQPASRGQVIYQSIKYHKPIFRLVRLKDVEDECIECDLVEQTLEDGSHPAYQAVSYVWGSAEKPGVMFVNGTKHSVTRSLFELLSNFRKQGHYGWLWIDGICINQDDILEKNHQVQQMGRIYATAKQVIFYLGPATANTDLLMDWLRRLRQLTDPKWESEWYSSVSKWSVGRTFAELPLELRDEFRFLYKKLRAAMDDLLTRSWFRRAWVIQEVGNAQDALVQCGDRIVPCHTFQVAIKLLTAPILAVDGTQAKELFKIMPTEFRGISFTGKDHGRILLQLLQRFPRAEATCEKDRIYALLGLSGTTEDELRVDYGKSEAEIVQDTISHIYRGINTKTQKFSFINIAAFLSSIQGLDREVFDQLVHLKDSHGIIIMLNYDVAGAWLLNEFIINNVSTYSDLSLRRRLSMLKWEVPVSHQLVRSAINKFGPWSEDVKQLVDYKRTRDTPWKNARLANLNQESDVVISSEGRAEIMTVFRQNLPSIERHSPTPLQRYFSELMVRAAEHNQIGFWFTAKHWTLEYEQDWQDVAKSSVQNYFASVRCHDSNWTHDGARFVQALCEFMAEEALSYERTMLEIDNTFTRPKETSAIPLRWEELHQPFLREAREWYDGGQHRGELVDFERARDPELWRFLETEMKRKAQNCDGCTIIGDRQLEISWLSLIVFPSWQLVPPLNIQELPDNVRDNK